MEHDYSRYSLEELREMRKAINNEIDTQMNQLREDRFNSMVKAIQAFREVCPCATVFDYKNSVSIADMTNLDNWDFGN